jgi:16S rRNA (cytidine1402-2'-O)-methyltransferase
MDEYPLYEAKARLSSLVRQVREGRSVVITVHGEPVAELRPYQPPERPPQTLAERIKELEALSRREAQTQLLIETPYRNAAMLAALLDALAPTTTLSVSCGLTLPEGWTRSAPVSAWRRQALVMPDRLPAVFALLAG